MMEQLKNTRPKESSSDSLIIKEMERWGEIFWRCSMVPNGPADYWFHVGVKMGFTEDSEERKEEYMRNLGRVFYFARKPTGEEFFAEELDRSEIARHTNLTPDRIEELIHGLVAAEVIKSKVLLRRKKNRV